jgi:hypothetical protein
MNPIKCLQLLVLLFCTTGIIGYSNAQLTGEWMDNNGACYKIRQLDNRVFWSMNAEPRVVNVFSGTLAGNTITGTWADVPGGNMMGSGTLGLQVENNNRMVKIDQTGNYGGSVWTRQPCGSCTFERSPLPSRFVIDVDNATNDAILTRIGNTSTYQGEYRKDGVTYATRKDEVWMGDERRIMIRTFETSDGWSCTLTGEPDCALRGSFYCTKQGEGPSTGTFTLRIE